MEKAGDYAGALASAREALTMYCEYLHDISWKPRIQECEERIRSLEKRGVRQATKTEKAKP
jgi:phage-related minor tail protein